MCVIYNNQKIEKKKKKYMNEMSLTTMYKKIKWKIYTFHKSNQNQIDEIIKSFIEIKVKSAKGWNEIIIHN